MSRVGCEAIGEQGSFRHDELAGSMADTPAALAHEALLDLAGVSPSALSDLDLGRRLAAALVDALGVVSLGEPLVHRFPDTARGPGGMTLLLLLSESHLALHSWPEHGALLISLCCCRPLPQDAALRAVLERELGPVRMHVQRIARGVP
jgi:S-adenosylmethionine decarboxylase